MNDNQIETYLDQNSINDRPDPQNQLLQLVSNLGKTVNLIPPEPMFPKTIIAIEKKPPSCPLKDI